ncbi:MAG: F0F1 ATP synthase subunit epsilon [Kineosporiaceae bacterium]
MPLQVELVAADRKIWSGEASMVVARTTEGDMGILPGHAPVLAVLASGELRITPASGQPISVSAQGGFLSVEHDRVTVVSDQAALVAGSASH